MYIVDLIIRCASNGHGRFFYLPWNDAQNHVRNEQTFLEYLVPTALEKIWETPSLGMMRGTGVGVGGGSEGWGGTVRYVGKYVDAHARAQAHTHAPPLCVRMRAKQASARVEF